MSTVTGLFERALGSATPAADDPVAEQVLDAALEVAAASGLRHLTMDDVAARAGVGRMTVYRRFSSRQQLIDALAVRECRRCLGRIAGALDPGEPIASLCSATLGVIRDHPLLARLARVEPEALVRELRRDDSAVLRLIHEFLVVQIRIRLPEAEPELLAELAVRLGLSFVLMPDSAIGFGDEDQLRALLTPLLAQNTGDSE